jgi:hypothetical protein
MDPKKQELNPELKQIYERVMNTDVKRPDAPSPGTPPPQAAPQPQTQPPVSAAPQPQAAPQPVPSMPYLNPDQPKATPPPAAPQVKSQPTAKKQGGKNAFSGKIIVALIAVVLVLWGVFWAKFFALF